jgi:hypothetical protein
MAGFLRAPVVLFVLTALLFAFAGVPTASAQSVQEDANAFARKISLMLTATPQAYPNAQMGGSVDFTYQGIACTRTTSNPDRGGVVTDTMTCRQTSPALTARCSTSTGFSFSCSVSDSAGNVIQIDGTGRFTPLVVGEDRVINTNGEQVGAVTGVAAPEARPGSGCGVDLMCMLGKLPGYLVSGIAYLLLVLSSLILWVAGSVFNWVVIRTVFQFATYFGTSEGMLIAWGVLRDIANIGLLFGFIFMGVATILNTQSMEGYSAKKALPRLIIFAVLLNFSLFATQGIIDVANGFASVFSTYAGEQCGSSTTDASGQSAEKCANTGISGKIAAAAGMNKLPSLGEAGDGISGMLERPYTTATMLIILSLLVTITAMVLFAAAIMLVIRVVMLSLLMVTSPIGFAGMAIPALQKISKDWWDQLLNQSFFAPLYLLMVFISLKLVDGLQTGGASVGDAITGGSATGGTPAANMQVLVVYAVVIGFMVASLMVAKKMGATGAGFATNAASAVVYGSLARGMNFTAGGAARLARQGVQNSRFGNTGVGRVLVNRGLRPLETTNLDMRRIAGVGGVLGAAGVTSGAAPAAHATIGEMQHTAGDFVAGKAGKELTKKYNQERAEKKLEDEAHADTPTSPPTATMSKESVDLMNSMSIKELAALHGIQDGLASMAARLTPEKFDELMKSDEGTLNAAQKDKLRASRKEYLTSANGAPIIAAMKPEAAAKLSPSLISSSVPGVGGGPTSFPVLDAMSARQLASINPESLDPANLNIIAGYINRERLSLTPKGLEFNNLIRMNPKIQSKWLGAIV